ncbi:MAG: 2-oxoacid:acceptor oxidoreductase subunit alpha [archaeon]
MKRRGLVWLIGGAQGSGVDTAANIFARAICNAGYNVFGSREYHSNIKGLHSYFHVRLDEKPVRSHSEEVNLLASFDAETIFRHAPNVVPNGGIIYDPEVEQQELSKIQSIDPRARTDIGQYLRSRGLSETASGMLQDAKKRDISLFPIPYMDLLREIAESIGESQLSRVVRMKNVLAVGPSFALLDLELDLLIQTIRFIFSDKPKVIKENLDACSLAYDLTDRRFGKGALDKLSRITPSQQRIFLQGTQAVALGKLLGGARIQTYYPITPAADESEYLEANEIFGRTTRGSILVFQAEDEIAAVNMASSAALAGARAATATSGPGFSLMIEGLSWAGNSEVPVVITYYQRGAPATGLPTRHGQDDLRSAVYAGHGEFARIVYASGDIEESFYDAARMFNYAERFQMPVIHLLDKAMANSSVTCPLFRTGGFKIERGDFLRNRSADPARGEEYKRFIFTESGVSPRIPLGADDVVCWYTGDEHDELGHISENPTTRRLMVEKRMKKIDVVDQEIPLEEKWNLFENGGDALIVTWGTSKGPILDALELLNEEDLHADLLQMKLLNPLPREPLRRLLEKYRVRIAVEMNYSGQLASLIRGETGIEMTNYILKYNGRPMSCDEVHAALRRALQGQAAPREVLIAGV